MPLNFHPSRPERIQAVVLDWAGTTPWWIAEFVPNLEAELGLALSFLALVPIYWPNGKPG